LNHFANLKLNPATSELHRSPDDGETLAPALNDQCRVFDAREGGGQCVDEDLVSLDRLK
jgi:hypothetical protein